jgi:hypothetical protein
MNSSNTAAKHVLLLSLLNDPFDAPGESWVGGGQLIFFDIGRYLVSRNMRVSYIIRSVGPEKPRRENLGPLCTIYRIEGGPETVLAPSQVAEELEAMCDQAQEILRSEMERPDVIHSQYWTGGACGMTLAREYSIRHVHNILSLGRVKSRRGEYSVASYDDRDRLELKIYSTADWLIAACETEARQLRKFYPEIQHNRLSVINYGVDNAIFTSNTNARYRHLRWPTY